MPDLRPGIQGGANHRPDSLTVHILAAVAKKEAKMISTRTKEALTATKARGVTLGNPQNLTLKARQRGSDVIKP
jgi:DNA invertase Pin-like site-specific DNA recombinase